MSVFSEVGCGKVARTTSARAARRREAHFAGASLFKVKAFTGTPGFLGVRQC